MFFARLAFTGGRIESAPETFRDEAEKLAIEMSAEWTLRPAVRPVRTVILVSKEDHCIADLLWRWRSRELNIDIPAVISNHNAARSLVERGVKLIGATCHYATEDLDEGPIIEQEVSRVEHYHEPEDLVRLGRDCERLALARGVRYHVEDRVLVYGNRAIVFRD
jgi:formyltetrahydrofolate hydrolase